MLPRECCSPPERWFSPEHEAHFISSSSWRLWPSRTLTQPLAHGCCRPFQGNKTTQGELKTHWSLEQLSGAQEGQPELILPPTPTYALSTPPFRTVMARDRDTSLPACRTPLRGWSRAECTRCSSCCPRGASPGNRIWGSESVWWEWLFVSWPQ